MKSQRWKVLIGSRAFGRAIPEHLTMLENGGCTVIPNTIGRSYHEEELIKVLVGVDAIITGTDELTARVIEHVSPSLKTIAKLGVGLNNIDLDAAWAAGIIVTITPGTLHDSVADHVMALTLALARKIIPTHLSSNSQIWTPFFGFELRNKVFGLIGLGKIGKAVCERARSFGMRLVAFDLYPDFAWAKDSGVELLSLEQVLTISDVVSLHVPLEWGKLPLLNAHQFSLMKNTAILINTARARLIDEDALINALLKGELGGVGLDMFSEDTQRIASLYRLPNVIMTPQSSGNTYEVQKRMGEMAIDNCLRALRGEIPLHPVWKEER